MEDKGIISIIVPVYNVEAYLPRCMEALLGQTYGNIEIILVDDGSPDNCPQLCDEYAQKDVRVKVVHKQNAGLGMARNSGLDVATGEYIAFVDSDDYVTKDMCEKLYAAAKCYNADVVYGGVYYDENGSIKGRVRENQVRIWQNAQVKDLLLDLIATEPKEKQDTVMEVSVWKAIFRKSVFDKYNIRFESERKFISEDVIFDIDYISRAQCVVLIPDPVYFYCVNPNSLSKTFRTDRFEKVKILYFEIRRRLLPLYEEWVIDRRCDRFLIARARTNTKAIIRHKSVIGKKEMKSAMKIIYNDKDLQTVLKRYPVHELPVKYMIVALCMKKKYRFALQLLLGKVG